AEALADRLTREGGDESCLRRAFLLCFSRTPANDEARIAASFFARGETLARVDERQRHRLLAAYCQALLCTAEFRTLHCESIFPWQLKTSAVVGRRSSRGGTCSNRSRPGSVTWRSPAWRTRRPPGRSPGTRPADSSLPGSPTSPRGPGGSSFCA